MIVDELNLSEKKIAQLKKKKLYTTEDIKYMFPVKYLDFRQPLTPDNALDGQRCVMVCTVMQVNRKSSFVEVIGRERTTFERISIKWFRQPYRYSEVSNLLGLDIAVGGIFKIDNQYGYEFVMPNVFTTDIENALTLYPVYPQIVGMSADTYAEIVNSVVTSSDTEDPLSEDFRKTFDLISENEMILNYHRPSDIPDIKLANKKNIYNRIYKFAKKMVADSENLETQSPYRPRILKKTNELIQQLQYKLTVDQQTVVKTFVEYAQAGRRVNALIQGDVGCGKTVCAFLIMFSMADNNYQSVLMAPTAVLARQHYEELSSYAEKCGYTTVYLGGDLKAKERRDILSKIKSGEANFIVGTHAVISKEVEFKNLALTVVDEEHKFGVIQRDSLRAKAKEGVHSISMSATPIPRSLAITLYGDAMEIFTIKTMPCGRLPIKTAVMNDDSSIFRIMQAEIERGHQCYIVCPQIDAKDDTESPESVEEVFQKVIDYFSIHNPSIKASIITGEMKDIDKTAIIDSFSENEIQILVATSIIEVGVNNQNATVIAIMNAERFGLASLHQLRGRVRRGKLQGYCILKSNELQNDRLAVMCSTTDGFEIAREDLLIRGAGDILGTRQSGDDSDIKLMLRYPVIYEQIRNYIKEKEICGNESLKL